MTPEAQRIAIAEALGATWSKVDASEFAPCWQLDFRKVGPGNYILSPGLPWQVNYVVANKPDDSAPHKIGGIPEYPADLNAMHESEKVLIADEPPAVWSLYGRYLDKLTNRIPWHATAAQRAEAFLRTLNLWKD